MKKLIILFLMLVPVTVTAVKYRFTDLGTLGGNNSSAFSINNSGQIVGSSTNALQFEEAFLYENGDLRPLGRLTTFGDSIAWSINDNTQIVGQSTDSFEFNKAFLYEDNEGTGEMKELGKTLGGNNSSAFSINNSGQIVGSSTNALQFEEAFLYEDGEIRPLGRLSTFGNSIARSINDNGQIVGQSTDSFGFNKAFLYEDNEGTGEMKELGTTLGGNNSLAFSINNSGQIVGQSTNDSGINEAFRYEVNEGKGSMEGLGTLGFDESSAFSINNEGEIVGCLGKISSSEEDIFCVEAFLYKETMFRLNNNDLDIDLPRGWVLSTASSINDKGQIVGTGFFNSRQRAFLLDPVPEVSITSFEVVQEGELGRYEVKFETDPITPVDVTFILDVESTATQDVDYDGTKVYDATGKVELAIVENNKFTLTGLKGNTDFFVQTFRDLENDEETELLTVALDSVSDGAILAITLSEATLSIDNVPIPKISINSFENVKEGEKARFEVAFEFEPINPVDITFLLGVDVDAADMLGIEPDTATRDKDYDGTKIYDAGEMELAIVENNKFTLTGLKGNTEFFVHTRQEFQNDEGTETFTVVLENVTDGAIPTEALAGQFAKVSIDEIPVPELSIISNANGIEGFLARFDVGFTSVFEQDSPVDITIVLGDSNDTAISGEDYDGLQVYHANGVDVLATVDENNRFTLEGVSEATSFYVRTVTDGNYDEEDEFFTATIVDNTAGIPLDSSLNAQAIIVNKPLEAFISSQANGVEGGLARFDVGTLDPLEPVMDITILLGNPDDTATPGEDYDDIQIYDANGADVLATVDETNRFTLEGVTGVTSFYVRTLPDQEFNEENEFFTAILDGITVGDTPISLDPQDPSLNAQAIIENKPLDVFISSQANGVEGVLARFDVGTLDPLAPVMDITILLGDPDDTATLDVDYDGLQVYDANGVDILATVDETNRFTLEGVTGVTSFYVKTFFDLELNEENEFFTVILDGITVGDTPISLDPLDPSLNAQAIIRNKPLDFLIISQANGVEGVVARFDVGALDPLGPVMDITILLGGPEDTATPGEDYDDIQIYDANGVDVLATVDENNRFVLKGVTGFTSFYIKTLPDQEFNEENEFFTAILDGITVGDTPIALDPQNTSLNAQAIIRDADEALDISIMGNKVGKEGYSAQFDISFNFPPLSAVDVIVALGAEGDTATLGIDYERSRIYDSDRVPLATVNGNEFRLKGLTGNTSFYVQTFREAPFLDDSVDHEGKESFTATLVSYNVGGNTIIPDTVRSAKADIEELQPDLITVSSNLDVYIPNMVQISEFEDNFYMVTLKHAGGNSKIWFETARVPRPHKPKTIYYSTSPPNQDINIFSGIYMGVPEGLEIFARLAFRGFNADGKKYWELTAAGEIQ